MPDVTQLPLRDIHLPGAVPWWPPAVGWWLLATLLIAAAAAAAFLYYRARHRRAALAAVRRLTAQLQGGAEPVSCLQQLSIVMRRYAMTAAENRSRAAGLTGRSWLEYLDSRWHDTVFAGGAGRLLSTAPYARPASVRREEALELARVCARWIAAQPLARQRRVGAAGAPRRLRSAA